MIEPRKKALLRWLSTVPVKEAATTVTLVFGNGSAKKAELEVEIADTPVTRALGLSYRDDLGEKRGMFFTKAGTFWMKDVSIPLDLLFLSGSGVILEKHAMAVQGAGEHLRRYAPESGLARYAVETRQGWMEDNTVKIGDRIVGVR